MKTMIVSRVSSPKPISTAAPISQPTLRRCQARQSTSVKPIPIKNSRPLLEIVTVRSTIPGQSSAVSANAK